MNNEPVAWMYEKPNGASKLSFVKEKMLWEDMTETPLYTHPAKIDDEGKVCARCGAIAYDPVITQTAKTLTDEEIKEVWMKRPVNTAEGVIDFARAILRKAQEK